MKKIMCICLWLLPVAGIAQEGRELLKKVNAAYSNAAGVSMAFDVEYYATQNQSQPTMKSSGEVRYDKKHYYSRMMGQTVVVNQRYSLVVSESQHTIAVYPGSKENLKQQQDFASLPDTSLSASSVITVIAQTGTTRRIKIVEKDGLYSSTELLVNTTTMALEEVVFYYRKLENGTTPKVVVKYSGVRFGATDESLYSEKQFVQKKNGQLTAAPAWSGYQIIDLTSTPKQ
jgi:outer membrane lipoprotein-sorting protein